jgi:aminopeptidase N
MERPDEAGRSACVAQFESADNMTDVLAALGALADADVPERRPALDRFRARWLDDAQVIDKWFSVQARSRLPGTLDRVRALMDDPLFSPRNPNKVRAVVGAFCAGNPAQFHAADGSGYAFLGEQVRRLDGSNPQLASRLLGAFGSWRRLDADRQRLVEAELATILRLPKLSRDQFEVASKLLAVTATEHETDRAVG